MRLPRFRVMLGHGVPFAETEDEADALEAYLILRRYFRQRAKLLVLHNGKYRNAGVDISPSKAAVALEEAEKAWRSTLLTHAKNGRPALGR